MKPNFEKINIFEAMPALDGKAWQKENKVESNWKTPEHIEVKQAYTKEDL